MTTQTHPTSQTLYERDYALWLETTIEQLRQGKFSVLDLENLIEELESMGRSDRRDAESLLTRLFEHLLKLSYWELEREYNQRGWKVEIRNFRLQINNLLEDSPSLKSYLEKIFEKSYNNARKMLIDATGLDATNFPTSAIATLNEALDEDWFPDDRC